MYQQLLTKLIHHVRKFLTKDIPSGYDTRVINIRIIQVVSRLLADADPDGQTTKSNATRYVSHRRTWAAKLCSRKRDSPKNEMQGKMDHYATKQRQLVEYGAMELVLEVLSKTDCDENFQVALDLGIGLLKNGNRCAQHAIHTHFESNPSQTFFQRMQIHMWDLQQNLSVNPNVSMR